jgi:hypothetical protein
LLASLADLILPMQKSIPFFLEDVLGGNVERKVRNVGYIFKPYLALLPAFLVSDY